MSVVSEPIVGGFILLEGLKWGNRSFCLYVVDHDFTRLKDGTLAYKILGYTTTVEEAQDFLYGKSTFIR